MTKKQKHHRQSYTRFIPREYIPDRVAKNKRVFKSLKQMLKVRHSLVPYRRMYNAHVVRGLFSTMDVAQEIQVSINNVKSLVNKGIFPSVVEIDTGSNYLLYWDEYWLFRLIVDSVKYANDLREFDGTADNDTQLIRVEYFNDYFTQHIDKYIKEYKDYVI